MKKFFTLIELIATIVVIGILGAIVIPNISDVKEEAIASAVKGNEKKYTNSSRHLFFKALR